MTGRSAYREWGSCPAAVFGDNNSPSSFRGECTAETGPSPSEFVTVGRDNGWWSVWPPDIWAASHGPRTGVAAKVGLESASRVSDRRAARRSSRQNGRGKMTPRSKHADQRVPNLRTGNAFHLQA